MREFKALLQIPEGSIEDEMILAVYQEDQALGSLGHCTINRDGHQYIGSFELTENVSETSHLRFMGHVDASDGFFVPERLLITSQSGTGETLPLSALILDTKVI